MIFFTRKTWSFVDSLFPQNFGIVWIDVLVLQFVAKSGLRMSKTVFEEVKGTFEQYPKLMIYSMWMNLFNKS